jgi:hypothetical protein
MTSHYYQIDANRINGLQNCRCRVSGKHQFLKIGTAPQVFFAKQIVCYT